MFPTRGRTFKENALQVRTEASHEAPASSPIGNKIMQKNYIAKWRMQIGMAIDHD
jgi:hypothetical protein